MFDDRPFDERVIENGVLLAIRGKLRGSSARSLGERMCEIAEEGSARVVLDLTQLRSIDWLGRTALESALDRGLRIDVVVRNRHEFDGCLDIAHHGLRFHGSLESAIHRGARSGRMAVGAV